MWKWINSFAQAEKAYTACNALLPYFAGLLLVALPVGVVWGLAFSPTDYQQFDVYRIIYIHVPTATLSLSAYVTMAVAAFVGLVWQWRSAYMAMVSIAPVGAVITLISLFTGAIWGKPTWGTYWIWDARLTSQLILLFLYIGVLSIYASFDDKQQGAKAAGVVAIIGSINIPIIKYSVEWWNTLHQTASISKLDKPSMPPEMYMPLLIAMLGVAGYIGTVAIIRLKNELIKREAHRPWVAKMFAEGSPQYSAKFNLVFYVVIALCWAISVFVMLNQGFKFTNFTEFLSMGGRGGFVWSSFGLAILVLVSLLSFSIFEKAKIREKAIEQKQRAERILEARAKRAKKRAEKQRADVNES